MSIRFQMDISRLCGTHYMYTSCPVQFSRTRDACFDAQPLSRHLHLSPYTTNHTQTRLPWMIYNIIMQFFHLHKKKETSLPAGFRNPVFRGFSPTTICNLLSQTNQRVMSLCFECKSIESKSNVISLF